MLSWLLKTATHELSVMSIFTELVQNLVYRPAEARLKVWTFLAVF